MPEITFEITDAQLKELDDRNAVQNAARSPGAAPQSRQSFAAAAFAAALAAPVKAAQVRSELPTGRLVGKRGSSKD